MGSGFGSGPGFQVRVRVDVTCEATDAVGLAAGLAWGWHRAARRREPDSARGTLYGR